MDYRVSHLDKGKEYDGALAKSGFDAFMAGRERRIIGEVVRSLFPKKVPRYLDFACGTGRIVSAMEENSIESYGIDVSEKMLQEAREKCFKTNFLLRDISWEPLDLEPFDLITAFRFFGNAQDELRRVILKRIHTLLRPGGYFVLNNHRNPLSVIKLIERITGGTDRPDLSYFKLKRYLRIEGFQIVRSYGVGWWMTNWRLNRSGVCESQAVRLVEPLSLIKGVALICPDAVIVAKKAVGKQTEEKRLRVAVD